MKVAFVPQTNNFTLNLEISLQKGLKFAYKVNFFSHIQKIWPQAKKIELENGLSTRKTSHNSFALSFYKLVQNMFLFWTWF